MSKYERTNIKSDMLKMVIIRFDYSGATNIVDFVNKIKMSDFMRSAFSKMRPMEQRQLSMSLRPRELYEGRMPLTQRQTSTLYHFFECQLHQGIEAYLDINIESTLLVVNINKAYEGSGKFTEFMAWLLFELHQYDRFISIDRIGIRKIDGQEITEERNFEYYFNDNYYVVKSWKAKPDKNKVNLTEMFIDEKVNFNVTQQIERPHGKKGKVFAIYDIDAFIVNGDINEMLEDKTKMINFLDSDMQEKMFRMFENVVTETYLESCYVSDKEE